MTVNLDRSLPLRLELRKTGAGGLVGTPVSRWDGSICLRAKLAYPYLLRLISSIFTISASST